MIEKTQVIFYSEDRLLKFARGKVWWLEDAPYIQSHAGEQGKRRPCLIISSNNRGRSRAVEVLTITSADKSEKCKDVNIPYENEFGYLSYIQCNQHFTINIDRLGGFIGVLPSSIMEKVNKGLLICQGLVDYAESLRSSKLTVDSHSIATAPSVEPKWQLVPEPEYIVVPLSSTEVTSEVSPKAAPELPPVCSDTHRGRRVWSAEKCKQFLSDIELLSRDAMMMKYNLKDDKAFRNRTKYVSDILNKVEFHGGSKNE